MKRSFGNYNHRKAIVTWIHHIRETSKIKGFMTTVAEDRGAVLTLL